MAEITLAKALKVKNRLAGRLAKAQADIQVYNSVPGGAAQAEAGGFRRAGNTLPSREKNLATLS
jgi:hypothetical protein